MNLFGVGPLELAVIIIVALIFVGPERLPKMLADIARTIREVRKYTGQFASEFSEVIKDLEKETEADRTEWNEIGQGLSDAVEPLSEEFRAAGAEAQKPEDNSAPGAAERGAAASPNGAVTMPAPAPNGAASTPKPAEEPR